MWVNVKDRFPDKPGTSKVKALEGAINPKEIEYRCLFRVSGGEPRFSKGDWTDITHWFEE